MIAASSSSTQFVNQSENHPSLFLQISKQEPLSLWYKDCGGKDSSISIQGHLVDRHGHPVGIDHQQNHIPLEFKLFYYTEAKDESTETIELQNVMVKNKPLLNIIRESPSSITRSTQPAINPAGEFQMRFRIEEVSKNRGGKRFVLQIIPRGINIDPILSHPIEVKSKPKRVKTEDYALLRNTYGTPLVYQPVIATAHEQVQPPPSNNQYYTPPVPITNNNMIASSLSPPQCSDATQQLEVIGSWCKFAMDCIVGIQFQCIGNAVESKEQKPIYQCYYCKAYKRDDDNISLHGISTSHTPDCYWIRMENGWNNKIVQCFAALENTLQTAAAVIQTYEQNQSDQSNVGASFESNESNQAMNVPYERQFNMERYDEEENDESEGDNEEDKNKGPRINVTPQTTIIIKKEPVDNSQPVTQVPFNNINQNPLDDPTNSLMNE